MDPVKGYLNVRLSGPSPIISGAVLDPVNTNNFHTNLGIRGFLPDPGIFVKSGSSAIKPGSEAVHLVVYTEV